MTALPEDAQSLLRKTRNLDTKVRDNANHLAIVGELEAKFRKHEEEKQKFVQEISEEKNRADMQLRKDRKLKDEQIDVALELAFSADVRVTVTGCEESIPALERVLKKEAPELAEALAYGADKRIVLDDTTIEAAKVFVRLIHLPSSSLTADTLAVPAEMLATTLFGALKLADAWLEMDTPVVSTLVLALLKLSKDPTFRRTSPPQWLDFITFAETAIANATPKELTQEELQKLAELPLAAREEKVKARKLLKRRAAKWKLLYDAGIDFFGKCAADPGRIPYAVMEKLPIVKVLETLPVGESKCRLACHFLRSINMLGEDINTLSGPCDALHALSNGWNSASLLNICGLAGAASAPPVAQEGDLFGDDSSDDAAAAAAAKPESPLLRKLVDSLRDAIITFLASDFDSLASSEKLIELGASTFLSLDASTFLSLLMSEELKTEEEDVVVDAFVRWSSMLSPRHSDLICVVAPAVRFPLAKKLHPLSAQLKELMRAHPVVKQLVDEATKQQLQKAEAHASHASPVPTTKRKLLNDYTPGGTVVPRAKARKRTPEAGVQPLTLEQLTQSLL